MFVERKSYEFSYFPEKGIVSFDFFTCGTVSPNISVEILKKELPHSTVVKKILIETQSITTKIFIALKELKNFIWLKK